MRGEGVFGLNGKFVRGSARSCARDRRYKAEVGTNSKIQTEEAGRRTGQAELISFFKELPPYEDFKAEILRLDGPDGLTDRPRTGRRR